MDGNQQQGGQQRQPPAVQVQGNRMQVNSKIFKGNNPNSPYSFFAKWWVKGRGENATDMNTIRIVFFTNQQNHPIADANKGDIIRFENGTLRFRTRQPEQKDAQGKPVGPDTVDYAEIIVHEQMSVERVDQNQQGEQQNAAQPADAGQAAQGAPEGQPAQAGTEDQSSQRGNKPIF